jgi:hypothetical protein
MGAVELRLTPFTQVKVTDSLADRMVALVRSAEDRLRMEMPQVVPRYANRGVALESIAGVRDAMEGNLGFMAYFVELDNKVIGVVSCNRQRLTGPRRWHGLRAGEELACGPLVAGWLGDESRERLLMPKVLPLVAAQLKASPYMVGRPWTIVRVGLKYVEECLADLTNGFGGFEPCAVDDYRQVDGVERLRRLYISRLPL